MRPLKNQKPIHDLSAYCFCFFFAGFIGVISSSAWSSSSSSSSSSSDRSESSTSEAAQEQKSTLSLHLKSGVIFDRKVTLLYHICPHAVSEMQLHTLIRTRSDTKRRFLMTTMDPWNADVTKCFILKDLTTFTNKMQAADGDRSSPSLEPEGHRGFQLKLSHAHLRRDTLTINIYCVEHQSELRLFRTTHTTMGRQLMWRLAIGTEMVFPWWFMAVTSTTLLSSLAPSPKQICRNDTFV